MDINVNSASAAVYTAPVRGGQKSAEETEKPGIPLGIKVDKWEGKPGEMSEMSSTIIPKEQLETIRSTLKEMSGKLEVNWNATVDPDGKIYSAAYVEAIVGQYQEMEANIKDYYSEGHRENLSFEDPYSHILQKYVFDDDSPFGRSPFFRSDMSKQEREWAFRQERAMLWGSHVTLNDPYALAAHGGVKNVNEIDAMAREAAQSKLDELIRAYKEEHGIEDD